tara:strand:+ start:328 stop:543 length:216 start_codon:yes stop_codon:yes gene_type:complete
LLRLKARLSHTAGGDAKAGGDHLVISVAPVKHRGAAVAEVGGYHLIDGVHAFARVVLFHITRAINTPAQAL